MSDINLSVGFVYDCECESRTKAFTALKIKEKYGKLNLIDVRENPNSKLLTLD